MRIALTVSAILVTVVSPVFADKISPNSLDPNNLPPPSGAILDLAGTPVQTGVWTQYSINFTATLSMTDITFLFRNDPGFTGFDNASVVDITHAGSNLFLNPGFELGTVGGAPVNWTFDNVFGAGFAGVVASNGSPGDCGGMGGGFPFAGNNGWCDGATQAYDAIDQTVATTVGDTYIISFWQNNIDTNGVAYAGGNYSQTSVNGQIGDTNTSGNGIDTLVYIGATIPTPVPEPASILLLGAVVLGLSYRIRRRVAK
jgi:hypothetical protein